MRWKSALSQWRGVYFIFDATDGKGYVGSAYGSGNLLGRWLNYALPATEVTLCSESEIPNSSTSRSCNACHRTWIRPMLFGSKCPGSSDYTRDSLTG